MQSPKGDPTFIKNKEAYFISVATAIGAASTHPAMPGGCVIVRGREIIGDGRSLYTESKVEIDCICYAIASAAKNGTATSGAVIYTTRYPFSDSIFQAQIMGIKKIVVTSHEWEPYYKDEFRRAARLARELSISIEPFFDDHDPRFTKNNQDRPFKKGFFPGESTFTADRFDPEITTTTHDDDPATI